MFLCQVRSFVDYTLAYVCDGFFFHVRMAVVPNKRLAVVSLLADFVCQLFVSRWRVTGPDRGGRSNSDFRTSIWSSFSAILSSRSLRYCWKLASGSSSSLFGSAKTSSVSNFLFFSSWSSMSLDLTTDLWKAALLSAVSLPLDASDCPMSLSREWHSSSSRSWCFFATGC